MTTPTPEQIEAAFKKICRMTKMLGPMCGDELEAIDTIRAAIASLQGENTRLKAEVERKDAALHKIATTPYSIYDGNRPFISEHDSGYAMGVADGHRLAAKWADEALTTEQQKE